MAGLALHVVDDPVGATGDAIVRRLAGAVRRTGAATLALSGGTTGGDLATVLAGRGRDEDWACTEIWQVDERVAPDGHPDRNANALAVLDGRAGAVHRMPVTDDDVAAAADRYASTLPARFDVVHLGIGPDGHTASWPPDDPIVATPPERLVALSQRYQGRVRMSLLPQPVNQATSRVVLVTGDDKAASLAAWVDGRPFPGDLPVRHVHRSGTVVYADAAAAALVRTAAR